MVVDIGRVTSVFTGDDEGKDKRIRVSVKVSPSETYDRIAYSTNMKGLWMVPVVGDHVEVYEIGQGVFAARTPQNDPPFTMPDLKEGDFCLRLSDNTEIKLHRRDDDTVDLDLTATGNVNVQSGSEKEITVSSPKVSVASPLVNVVGGSGGEVFVDSGYVAVNTGSDGQVDVSGGSVNLAAPSINLLADTDGTTIINSGTVSIQSGSDGEVGVSANDIVLNGDNTTIDAGADSGDVFVNSNQTTVNSEFIELSGKKTDILGPSDGQVNVNTSSITLSSNTTEIVNADGGSLTVQSPQVTVQNQDGSVAVASPSITLDSGASGSVLVNSPNVTIGGDDAENVVIDAPNVALGGTSTTLVARKGDTVETNDPLTGSETGVITSGASNVGAK